MASSGDFPSSATIIGLSCSFVGILNQLMQHGGLMTDPKFHDIPRTAGNRVTRLLRELTEPPEFLTVHASGGIEMMMAAKKAAGQTSVLAITALTSLQTEVVELAYGASAKAVVLRFAQWAVLAGVDGIVCSGIELDFLAQFAYLNDLIRVVPGIYPNWAPAKGDQKRVRTPAQAIKAGANFLVIGSSITGQDDPVAAADRIMGEVRSAREESACIEST